MFNRYLEKKEAQKEMLPSFETHRYNLAVERRYYMSVDTNIPLVLCILVARGNLDYH